MESEYTAKKPRKLTDDEIARLEADLVEAEPYPDDYHVFDDPDWDEAKGSATLAKKFLEDDRKYYPEYYQNK